MFCEKGVLRNFAKLTGKHLCQSLFIIKETLAQMFSCEFCEISKNIFFYRTPHVAAFARNELCSEYTKIYRDRVFCFPVEGFSLLQTSWIRGQTWQRQFEEAWTWHSRWKIPKTTGKVGLKFCKLISWVINQALYTFSKISVNRKICKVLKVDWHNLLE